MATPPKGRFWRVCRICFRRFRIAVWFILFLLLSSFVYLNQIGLPDFAKQPLLDKLRQRGLNLQFSRVRLRWYQGIVADNVRFARGDEPNSPQLTLQELQVLLNLHALVHRQLQVDSVVFHKGRLLWPISDTNQPPRNLLIDNIETRVRFLPDDLWALDHFTAGFAGAHLQLSGTITNASAIRQWKFVQVQQPTAVSAVAWQTRLRDFSEALQRIQFSTAPDLSLVLQGDARDLQSFGVTLLVAAPGAQTPWGTLAEGRLTARLFPAPANALSRAELVIEAAHAETPWAALTNLALRVKLLSKLEQPDLVSCELKLTTDRVQTEWAGAGHTFLTAQWLHSRTNPVPLSGRGQLHCSSAATRWGTIEELTLAGSLAPNNADTPLSPDAGWGWWTNLQPYLLDWQLHLTNMAGLRFQAEDLDCAGRWQAPELRVTSLEANLYRGAVKADADLDVASRRLRVGLNSSLDPQRLGAALPQPAREWLGQFSWPQPPVVQGSVFLTAPSWTNHEPNWSAEVLPSLALEGKFDLPSGGVFQNKLQLSRASSHVSYTNRTWHLPDLTLSRPEGQLLVEHRADETTRDFYWHAVGGFDVFCVRPFLQDDQTQALDLVTFTQPPQLDLELWGRSHEADRLGARARIALTNFTFRGETLSGVTTDLQFTNQALQVLRPQVWQGGRGARADGLTVDFGAQLVYLTNGFSTMDPGVICRAIGPQVAQAIQPYQFLNPPTARVQGTIPMRGEQGADLHFDLDGGPFRWLKFNLPHVAGHVHWVGQNLTLSDVRAGFYGGQAAGAARFDFRPNPGTDFQFALGVTNVQLHALMEDLDSPTNHLEGLLSGALSLTRANSENWRSVNGYGEVQMRDGLLWDIPLLGIFSPILNGVSPGLGNSRASAASCGFVITNGFIFSNDLEIRSTGMRLKYRGIIDLESRVNARVEAELLRDMWAVGPLVSAVFWPVTKMFEYKVTNTLADPKAEPVFIVPKLVLFPFHPVRTLKNLFPEGPTNAPPISK